MKTVTAIDVFLAGKRVGELLVAPRRGLFFAYDERWLATGFNLSPLNMAFNAAPQLAADPVLFDGLPGVFADSLPDGWGMLLMDRFSSANVGLIEVP